MENIDKIRKQTDVIILYVLTKGLRHIDELKQIIDEKFSEIKTGTLYAVISKLKTQKYIAETRASSIDGSRRKYFSLTKEGEKLFNEKYLNVFDDVEIPYSTFQPQNSWQTKTVKSVENKSNLNFEAEISLITSDNQVNEDLIKETNTVDYLANETSSQNYLDLIKTADFSFDDIDFSKIENSTKNVEEIKENNSNYVEILSTEQVQTKKILNKEMKEEPTFTQQNLFDDKEEKESIKSHENVDFDSIISSEFDYSAVLNKLFPKNNLQQKNNLQEVDNNEETQEEIQITAVNNTWNDAYELAEKDGIKIRTSSDTNRYQGNKILINKLLLFTSIITFFLASFEYLIFNMFLGIPLSINTYSKVAIIFGIIVLITLTIYLLYPKYALKDLPKLSNCLEIALIIAIATLVICFAISAIIEIDFNNIVQVYNVILFPTIISLNIPLFFIIEYSISKLDVFQTI